MVEQLKQQHNINDIWIPFELYPDLPQNGITIDQFVGPLSQARAKMRLLNMKYKYLGINLKLPSFKYNTHNSLLFAEFAKDNGKYLEFSHEIFSAYFEHDLNISCEQTLAKIFTKLELDFAHAKEVIHTDFYEQRLINGKNLGQSLGIEMLPTFIINDTHQLVGAVNLPDFEKFLKA